MESHVDPDDVTAIIRGVWDANRKLDVILEVLVGGEEEEEDDADA